MADQFKKFLEVIKALKKDSIRDKDKIDAIFLKKLIEAGKINKPGRG
jgi:hypothetical protein